MIIVMKPNSPTAEIERVKLEVQSYRITPEITVGQHKTIIGLVGNTEEIDVERIQNISHCIEQVLRVKRPFKRTFLEFRHGDYSDVVVPTPNGLITFGRNHPLVIVAEPCSVEMRK